MDNPWDDMNGTLRRIERQVEDARSHLIHVENIARDGVGWLPNLRAINEWLMALCSLLAGIAALLCLVLWRVW